MRQRIFHVLLVIAVFLLWLAWVQYCSQHNIVSQEDIMSLPLKDYLRYEQSIW